MQRLLEGSIYFNQPRCWGSVYWRVAFNGVDTVCISRDCGILLIPQSKLTNDICVCYRLAYGVWLLTEMVHKCPTDVKFHLMYDVACILVRHLQVSVKLKFLVWVI